MLLVGHSLILIGCNTTAKRLDDAAIVKAVAETPTILPDYPAYCSDLMPIVKPALQEPVWGSQARWEIVRKHENDRIEFCAKWYGTTASNARGIPKTK